MSANRAYLKGSAFERAVKSKLEEDGWIAIRSAGSKKPDLIAAKDRKIIVIECKSTKNSIVYLEEREIENLKKTAEQFGAESLFAVKHVKNKNWFIIAMDNVEKTDKGYRIKLDI